MELLFKDKWFTGCALIEVWPHHLEDVKRDLKKKEILVTKAKYIDKEGVVVRYNGYDGMIEQCYLDGDEPSCELFAFENADLRRKGSKIGAGDFVQFNFYEDENNPALSKN